MASFMKMDLVKSAQWIDLSTKNTFFGIFM